MIKDLFLTHTADKWVKFTDGDRFWTERVELRDSVGKMRSRI